MASNATEQLEEPTPPNRIFPLCLHNVGGPPDFARLPSRRMQWLPVLQQSRAPYGQRQNTGWTEQ
eukprot:572297-Karenia_brevis.AAC.1